MADLVRFPSSSGPQIAGVIDEPEGEARGWGIFVHGFTLGKDTPAAARICKQLASEGVGMMRFDALGLGDSEGDWGDGSFTVKVDDTARAVQFMKERGTDVDFLVGHSFGGAAVIAAATQCTDVKAVVTVGAPFDPREVERHYDAVADKAVTEGTAQWLVGGRALTLKRSFVEDVRHAELKSHVAALRVPLLILHSPTDSTVDITNASDIFFAAHHPRSFVSLEGSDHFLVAPGQAQRAGRIISAWADQYLD